MKATYHSGRWMAWVCAIAVSLFGTTAIAEDASTDATDLHEHVDRLVAEFNDASFSTRRVASQKLESLGYQAFEPLADAAITGNPETVQRILEILKRASLQNDAQTKTAAKQAIDRIASSSGNSASRAATELRKELEMPASARNRMLLGNARAARARNVLPAIQILPNARIPAMPNPQGRIQVIPGMPFPGRPGGPGWQVPGMQMPGMQMPGMAPPLRGAGIAPGGNAPPRNAALSAARQAALTRAIAQLDQILVDTQQRLERINDAQAAENVRRTIDNLSREKTLLINELLNERAPFPLR